MSNKRRNQKGKTTTTRKSAPQTIRLDERFPHLARWVAEFGWVEIGQDDYNQSFLRALDSGGMVWEGKRDYASLDHALRALDRALGKWMEQNA
jgi:hypothetical protein